MRVRVIQCTQTYLELDIIMLWEPGITMLLALMEALEAGREWNMVEVMDMMIMEDVVVGI